jgi:hypothetical protein
MKQGLICGMKVVHTIHSALAELIHVEVKLVGYYTLSCSGLVLCIGERVRHMPTASVRYCMTIRG